MNYYLHRRKELEARAIRVTTVMGRSMIGSMIVAVCSVAYVGWASFFSATPIQPNSLDYIFAAALLIAATVILTLAGIACLVVLKTALQNQHAKDNVLLENLICSIPRFQRQFIIFMAGFVGMCALYSLLYLEGGMTSYFFKLSASYSMIVMTWFGIIQDKV